MNAFAVVLEHFVAVFEGFVVVIKGPQLRSTSRKSLFQLLTRELLIKAKLLNY